MNQYYSDSCRCQSAAENAYERTCAICGRSVACTDCVRKPYSWRSYPKASCTRNLWRSTERSCGCGNTRSTACGERIGAACPIAEAETSWCKSGSALGDSSRRGTCLQNDCGCGEGEEYVGQSQQHLATVYPPHQEFVSLYDPREGLCNGTVFCELDKPFRAGGDR